MTVMTKGAFLAAMLGACVSGATANVAGAPIKAVVVEVAKDALPGRMEPTTDILGCDQTVWTGLFGIVGMSSRNCAGAVYTRGDTVMLVYDADFVPEPDEFAGDLLPGHEKQYAFNTDRERCAAVFVRGSRLYIGGGSTQGVAEDKARSACARRSCRRLLFGCNSWASADAIRPRHETIEFRKVDGSEHMKCGDQLRRECRVH